MANPQAENGHTDIANEILEQLALTHFSGNEWKVLCAVIRKTWGWHKKSDAISLTQFQISTGLSRPSVIESLGKLVGKKVLVVVGKKGLVTEYLFNKDYEKWASSEKGTSRVFPTRVVGKKEPEVVGKKEHTKETKETIQKKEVSKDTLANADKRNPDIENLLAYWTEVFGATRFTQQDRFALSNLLRAKYMEASFPNLEPVDRVRQLINVAGQLKTEQYAPRVSSPSELHKKFNEIKMFVIKKKGNHEQFIVRI